MRRLFVPTWLILFLLVFFQPSPAKQAAKAKKGGTHPDVPAAQQCSDCHGDEFADWQAGKHGQAVVKCLVCHGAIESNFIPKPTAARCLACHGEIVRHPNEHAQAKGKGCFACHDAHRLNPRSHKPGVL